MPSMLNVPLRVARTVGDGVCVLFLLYPESIAAKGMQTYKTESRLQSYV